MYAKKLSQDPETGDYTVQGKIYGQDYQLCPEQRFWSQTKASYCSGALVTPNLVLTAGHCISIEDCKDTKILFDFRMDDTQERLAPLKQDQVYQCKRIAARALDGKRDWALVELDRPVENREPIPLVQNHAPQYKESLFVVGHPHGLPQKIAGDGIVRDRPSRDWFPTNLDTVSGNSGSPVFNAQSGEIIGVHVRGDPSRFTYDSKRKCSKLRVCPKNGCKPAEASRVEEIVQFLSRVKK
jgi:V8-like Glu-specific endopeptidase